MKGRLTAALLAGALLALPASVAHAEGSNSWQVCGGSYSGYSGFALCASVSVTVTTGPNGENIVTMEIYNMSGANGSYAGTVFTSLGLDNVVPALEVIDGSLTVTGPCLEEEGACDYSEHWTVYNDKSIGGGIKVDVLAGSFNSQYSIASQCGVDAGETPGHERYYVTDCLPGGANYVTLTFEVTNDFDPSQTGYLFIKGQNGYQGQSTTCITDGPKENCGPTTVVPEPLTMTLFGTGLAAMGGMKALRRRRDESGSGVENG